MLVPFFMFVAGRNEPHKPPEFRGLVRLKRPEESISKMGSEL